jgi:CubicO group peptidase (beta-lactamase class C family)
MLQHRLNFFASLVVYVGLAAGAGAQTDLVFPGKDWTRATPESQGISSGKLNAAIEYLKTQAGRDGVNELICVRNGRLVWQGTNIDHVHGVWSCTKVFTSTVLGLLIDDARCTLDAPVKKVVPELAEYYPTVAWRHFVSMTSGYRAEGDEPQGSYTHGPSSTPFRPNPTALFSPPGSRYAYWDSAMNELGLALARLAGESMESLFERRIAAPIGMNRGAWRWGEYAKEGKLVVNGGSGNGNKHVFISARELARLGHLFLNRGRWQDRQLISTGWVAAATAVQVPATTPLGHTESGIDGRGVYGFNWWVNGIQPNGQRLWPQAPAGTFAAHGHNNNFMFVIPEWRMVVVRLGLDQADRKITPEAWSGFFARVKQALDQMSAQAGQASLAGLR